MQDYEYDSFGNLKDQKNRIKQPYAFTAREWYRETGLYYYRARYYDPEAGRFISKDPIGFAGGDLNLYNYVGGNPVNWVDPSGLEVIYGNFVVTDPGVRNALSNLDAALPTSDINVSGGDRYYDQSGNIRSTSNNGAIPNSAAYSTHLMGLVADFYISNYTPSTEFLLGFFDNIINNYTDGHLHGDLRDRGRFCTEGISP